MIACLGFCRGVKLMFSKIILVLSLFSSGALAHEKLVIQEMHEIHGLRSRLPVEKSDTLFVFDIDNTLLRTRQDLGGDAWFTWQETLLKQSPQSPDLVALDFNGLLVVQGWLFALSSMIPPEAGTPALFRELQEAGHPVILLTSRGTEFENYTERELARNQYDSKRTALAPRAGFAARFLPYDLNDLERSCLTQADAQRLNLPPARPIVYRRGVVLTSGQHKGAMLRSLLCKVNRSFSHIVFVDDHQKHVDRVYAAYENQPGEVLSVKYAYMDAEVSAFQASDKSLVREQWQKLKDVLGDIF